MNKRAFLYITAAVALLAVLAVLLCALAGGFDFSAPDKTEPPATEAPPIATEAPAATAPPEPEPTAAPEPTPFEIPEATVEPVETVDVTVTAGKGGVVTPRGLVTVPKGGSAVFGIVPDEGFEIGEIKLDGEDIEPTGILELTDVTEPHSVYVVFRALPTETEPEATPDPDIWGDGALPESTPAPDADADTATHPGLDWKPPNLH